MATTAAKVLEFVMDVERYRDVDAKIGKIHWVERVAQQQLPTMLGQEREHAARLQQ